MRLIIESFEEWGVGDNKGLIMVVEVRFEFSKLFSWIDGEEVITISFVDKLRII